MRNFRGGLRNLPRFFIFTERGGVDGWAEFIVFRNEMNFLGVCVREQGGISKFCQKSPENPPFFTIINLDNVVV